MSRNPLELEFLAREHMADVAAEVRRRGPARGSDSRLLRRLCRGIGRGLIAVGERMVGRDLLPAASGARPAATPGRIS